MSVLVSIRESIKSFYGQFAGILNICARFLLAVFTFLLINREIGFNPLLVNMFVVLIMALIASILSVRVTVFLAAVLILGNSFSLGYDVFAVTALLIILLYIMFVSFVPDDALELILMPVGIAFGVPAIVPVCCGLKRNPGSIAALCPGIIMHYYILALGSNAEAMEALGRKAFTDRLKILMEAMLGNKMIVMNVFAAAAVVIIVYAIRKLQADYAYEISALAGCIMYVVMAVISNNALELNLELSKVIIGALIALVLAIIFLFFVHHVDYSKTERLTFEDDEYFYYVKAVPKVVGPAEDDEDDEEEEEPDAPVVEQAALYAALQEAADAAARENTEAGSTQNIDLGR